MMLQHDIIPPHIGIKKRINSKFPPLDTSNIYIAKCPMEFKRRANKQKRTIVVNNFDAAGGNTAILIEDAPVFSTKGTDPRTVHVVTVSAKTPFSFRENAKRLLAYITKHPESSIGDISYTTTARRMHHMFRAAFAVSTTAELQASLKDLVTSTDAPIRTSSVDVVFVFAGQGSHYFKMGKELFDNCSTFRRDILDYDNICQTQNLPSFKALIDGTAESLETLSHIQIQLALIALELALANLWLYFGIKPALVIGHSLGEYAALCVAGVLSVNDLFYLVGKRASLITNLCSQDTHAMLTVMLDAVTVKKDLLQNNTSCEIVCFNSLQSTTIGGGTSEISFLKTFYESNGVKATKLETSFAFHSSQIDSILVDFRIVAKGVSFSKPIIPVASTLLGSIVQQEGVFTAEYLCRHARDPVKFSDTLETCKTTGIADEQTLWLEIGPSAVCLSMIKSVLNVSEPFIVRTLKKEESNLVSIAKSIAKIYVSGVDVNWTAYHQEYELSHQLMMLPTYAFDLQNYWIQYEGNWCLQKNMTPNVQLIEKSTVSFFGTTTLQQIQNEDFDSSDISVTFVSDIADSKLRNVIQGHLVNKVAVCPGSVYSDMALTAAKYIHNRRKRSNSPISMDIVNMKIIQPLILTGNFEKQYIYVLATCRANSDIVELIFASEEGSIRKQHGSCVVQYGDGVEWMTEWARQAYLIQTRMNCLVEAAEHGKAHQLLRGIVYKLFSVFVQYSEKYRGMEEVWMDCNMLEATSNIKFQTTPEDGSFEYSPYWLDSLYHLSGFVLHGTDTMNDDFVYIADSWKGMRIVGQLSTNKTYKNYVRMQPIDNGQKMIGDVYVFEENRIIAVCTGIQFQQIRRCVLEHILSLNADKIVVQKTQVVSENKGSCLPDVSIPLAASSNTFLFDEILEMIANEVGVKKSKLDDSTNLIDIGVDSLLTISILTRLHQLTGLDIPSSLLYTHSSIGDLKKLVGVDQSKEIGNSNRHNESSKPAYLLSSTTLKSTSDILDHRSSDEVVSVIRSIIACEIGCREDKILPSTVLADLEIDNQTRSSIRGIIQAKFGVNLSESFFQNRITFLEIVNQLGFTFEGCTLGLIQGLNERITVLTKQSTSVLLHRTSTSRSPLFLFPEGSGSASSYMSLPLFDNNMTVYALNSPFLDCPCEFTCTMEEVAAIYLAEIRKRQPLGPYILGGWSSGGIVAYEAATQLIAYGEKVLGLILIDSPCPLTFPPLSVESIDIFESIGIADNICKGAGKIPKSLKQHFIATLKTLENYTPKSMDSARAPKSFIVWANEGILESTKYDHIEILRDVSFNKTMVWLLDQKKDYNPKGWEELISSVECVVIPGNHFTIMKHPQVTALMKEIEKAVAKFTKI
ncbi:hypothetical protein I4U23_000024 [Adineta vaga]|nr:hypothetical protein I4U23_000024 [Adineta vaga]